MIQRNRISSTVLILTVAALAGVAWGQPQDSLKPEPKAGKTAKPAQPDKSKEKADSAKAEPAKPAEKKSETSSEPAKRESFTAENNPTTKGGRGAPDLENKERPCAWVFIDGKGGKFKEEDGQKLLQWFIEEPVKSSPKFRVEAFEPLLGTPKDFKAVLRTLDSSDSTNLVYYGIAANDGTFEVGKEYALLNPGANFVLRNLMTGDEVKEIAPLPSGQYMIAAGVKNAATGKETLAVTYFTVKSDE